MHIAETHNLFNTMHCMLHLMQQRNDVAHWYLIVRNEYFYEQLWRYKI